MYYQYSKVSCNNLFFQIGDELMVKKACFKNRLHSLFGDKLDIPPWWDIRSYYNATLAHMVNNRFVPNINCRFGAMEHPRFGWVSSKPFLIYSSAVHFNFHLKAVQDKKVVHNFEWLKKATFCQLMSVGLAWKSADKK